MSFLRKGILASGGQVFCIMLSMIVGVLFSRKLGPAGMGQYELLRSVALTVGALGAFGLGNANIFFLNSRNVPPEEIVSNAIKALAALGLLVALGVGTAILVAPDYFGHVPTVVAVLFGLGVGTHTGRLILRPILTARLEVRRMVWVELIRQLVLLGGGLVLVGLGCLSAHTGLVLLALGFYGSLLLAAWFLRRFADLRRRFDWRLFRGVLVYGLKLGAATALFGLTQNLGVFLLRALRPGQFADVGLYTRAVAVCALVLTVPVGIAPLLYAKWSGAAGEERTRQVEMAARMNTTFGIAAALVAGLLGKYVIWLLYGAQFLGAQQALQILAPALVLVNLYNPCGQLLASAGQAAMAAYILAGTLVVVCVATILMVPGWGIRGAAIGLLCGNVFMAAVTCFVCWRLHGLNVLHCLFVRRSDLAYVRRALWARG